MELSYELNVKITGKNLQEIDDGLVQAATARVMARMVKPEGKTISPENKVELPPNVQLNITKSVSDRVSEHVEKTVSEATTTVAEVDNNNRRNTDEASATVEKTEAPKRPRGRPSKLASLNAATPREPLDKPTPAPVPQPTTQSLANEAEQPTDQLPKSVKTPASTDSGSPVGPAGTLDDCITALSSVNTKLGIDKAKSILTEFGRARCKELVPEQFEKFVNRCTEVVNG